MKIFLLALFLLLSLHYPLPAIAEPIRPCLADAMAQMGLDREIPDDPQLIESILRDDMKLSDFASVQTLVQTKLSGGGHVAAMVQEIIGGIHRNHPAIVEFLCRANEKKLLPSGAAPAAQEMVTRSLHHTLILNELTHAMAKDPKFAEEMYEYLMNQRERMGIRKGFFKSAQDIYRVTGGLFEVAKMLTMDSAYCHYSEMRAQKGEITRMQTLKRQIGVILNITEAVLTDCSSRHKSNAFAGACMAINPQSSMHITNPERFIEYDLSKEWTALYETWNLAFVTGNLSNLHLLYPKLLAPQVLNATPKEYLFNRALALWLTINFHIFSLVDGKEIQFQPNEELVQLWGQINAKYAHQLLKKK